MAPGVKNQWPKEWKISGSRSKKLLLLSINVCIFIVLLALIQNRPLNLCGSVQGSFGSFTSIGHKVINNLTAGLPNTCGALCGITLSTCLWPAHHWCMLVAGAPLANSCGRRTIGICLWPAYYWHMLVAGLSLAHACGRCTIGTCLWPAHNWNMLVAGSLLAHARGRLIVGTC